MAEAQMNTYEGMFLFPQSATGNLQDAVDHLNGILERADAEMLAFSKWDERRLAYEIKGNKRGVYFLTYFKAPSDKIAGIERDCNLSEQLLRFLVLRADNVTDEQIQAADGQAELRDEINLRGKEEDAGATSADQDQSATAKTEQEAAAPA